MMDYSLIAFIMAVLGVSLRAIAIARIKYRHHSEWSRLYKPAYLDQGPGDMGTDSINKFLFHGEFLRIKDWVLNIICFSMYLVIVVGIAFMVLAMIYVK